MSDLGPLTQVAGCGILAVLVACLLFGRDSGSDTPGLRVFPAKAAEWVAYWFHTLGLLLFCIVLLVLHPAVRGVPYLGTMGVFTIGIGVAFLLMISAAVFWRRARSLSHAALGWSLFTLMLFFLVFPAIKAG